MCLFPCLSGAAALGHDASHPGGLSKRLLWDFGWRGKRGGRAAGPPQGVCRRTPCQAAPSYLSHQQAVTPHRVPSQKRLVPPCFTSTHRPHRTGSELQAAQLHTHTHTQPKSISLRKWVTRRPILKSLLKQDLVLAHFYQALILLTSCSLAP